MEARETSELVIRAVTEDDAEALLSIYGYYVRETAVSFEYETPGIDVFRARIRRVKEEYPYLAAVLDGELVGYAYAVRFKERAAYGWSVETTIYLRRDMKRRGIGGRLYAALEDMLRRQGVLNLNACIACPESEDEYLTLDSARFHERMGYARVGEFHRCACKFGRWYNIVWMEKAIGEHTAEPAPIRPWPEIEFGLPQN